MCQTQINQLKQIPEAKTSIINSFNAFAANRTYDDGIKAITKASNFFIDNDHKDEAEQILEFGFEGIEKYYHVLIINEEESHFYIYECIDKYIDLLFDKEKFNKSANVSEKAAELIKEENKEENKMICKYYGFWALSELLGKNDKKYQEVIDKGMDFEKDGDKFCSKINRLVNVINQKDKENEKLIKKLYSEIARNVPSSMARVVNIKYVQVYIVKAEDEINTIIDVDLKGTIYGSKIAMEYMSKNHSGAIYNIEGYGSNDAHMLGLNMYGTSKRAVTYFTESLAKEAEERNTGIIVGKLSPGIMITDFTTHSLGTDSIKLSEKTKKVYNILGDTPETVGKFLVDRMVTNTKNNAKINWLTNSKAFFRFLTAGFNKRNFFDDSNQIKH